jgi:hypothetical protein
MHQSQKYGSLLRFRIKENGGKFEFEFLISDENAEIIAHISRQQRPPKNVM